MGRERYTTEFKHEAICSYKRAFALMPWLAAMAAVKRAYHRSDWKLHATSAAASRK